MSLFALLLAAATPERVDPGLEPADVVEQYRAWATSQKRTGPRAELVCQPFAEGLKLCFSHATAKGRAYYTAADGLDAAALFARGVGTQTEALARLERTPVEGFAQSYWLSSRGDGRDHVPVLFPEDLRALVGGDVVIAAPVHGVLLAWLPGDLDFDKAVAVGVKQMYETLPDPVSPLLYRWDGKLWRTWGEAKLAEPIASPPPSPVPG